MRVALSRAGMSEIPADSGIHVQGDDIQKILFAIDVTTSELLLAKELDCDLVITHHPIGDALISFHKVVQRHYDFLVEHGVSSRVAEEAVKQLVDRVEVRSHPANYTHLISVARQLELPLMNIHLPLDEIGRLVLSKTLQNFKISKVSDIIRAFESLTEFQKATTKISIRMGSYDNDAGKIALVFGAGTNGGYPVAKAYFDHGIDTVIYLHIDYEDLRKLREECKGNLIVLGHMAGDSVGINVFLKELRSKEVEAITIGVIE
jgi:putative NIF3 family GTP cyclohydrolase 1 type 2